MTLNRLGLRPDAAEFKGKDVKHFLLSHQSRRTALFTLLYFSEGAPIGFIWWALPTLLRSEGVPLDRITSVTALLVLPWAFKFVWSPFVDRCGRSSHGFRSSILVSQFAMGLCLIPLLWLDPATQFGWWKTLLLFHAIAAATQDVGIDALAISVVPEHERGRLNGCMQAGMLVGRSLFGGVALLAAARFGWNSIIIALVACIWTCLLLLLKTQEPKHASIRIEETRALARVLTTVFRNRQTWVGLGFALLAGAGFEATGSLAGPYLIDHGASTETVGLFYGFPVVAATLLGGLSGGALADRFEVRRTVAFSMMGWILMICALATVDTFAGVTSPHWPHFALLIGMYFFVGAFTASSYALFMRLTNPLVAATQFSVFMAATNGCESWSAWTGGWFTILYGYPVTFVFLCGVSLASLLLLRPLQTSPVQPAQLTDSQTRF